MKRIFSKFGSKFEAKSESREQTSEADVPVRRRQRGSILLLTALLATVMIGMLALSIDLGFAFSSRSQFQNGIDAAALAAAAALRLTVEPSAAGPQQTSVAQELAVQYAGRNQVRRYADPDPKSNSPNANKITITAGNVQVQNNFDFPRVKVEASIEVPTLFAGLFGLNGFNISSAATATVFPVDGGVGTIGAGTAAGGGCWRPLLLPDTFYDQSDNVHIVGDPLRGSDEEHELPKQPGDYYRSRFAAGLREVQPFIDSFNGGGGLSATGLRDTRLTSEVDGNKTIIGRYVEFKQKHYRIANLSSLPRVTADVLSVGDMSSFGYCGQIRVGDDVAVYNKGDLSIYEQVRLGLQSLNYRMLGNDSVDTNLLNQFRYIKSGSYPSPNSHGAIIPVMLFNPVELARNDGNFVQLKITNIGLFYLEQVRDDGTLYGFFVREIIAGATPIAPANMSVDRDPSFKRSWLPTAVQLVK
ncbi:MAG: pilus assembly protein TadG-related protein [Acidobacteriota bacterium]